MDFIALDFETANNKNDRACSVGLTIVHNSQITLSTEYLINPETRIDQRNTAIHGITNSMVANSPTFKQLWLDLALERQFSHFPIIAHGAHFDFSVLQKMAKHYKLNMPVLTVYCTQQLWKRNYNDRCGSSLASICACIGYDIHGHHGAGADSRAAAEVMLHLLKDESTEIFPVIPASPSSDYVRSPDGADLSAGVVIEFEVSVSDHDNMGPDDYLSPDDLPPILAEAKTTYDDDCPILFEERIFVLTGDFGTVGKTGLTSYIEERGGLVKSAVSRKTDYVIVGYQDLGVVVDTEGAKSTKVIKAEALRSEGSKVRIISDERFFELMNNTADTSRVL